MQAHGTGTPQNRVTESHILNEVARSVGIEQWPVGAVKAYLGHSIGCAGADQLAATLGAWRHGLLPGITTLDAVAEDVHHSNLSITADHLELDRDSQAYAIINAKGFGGNNASATVLSPGQTRRMLERRHGREQCLTWEHRHEAISERASQFEAMTLAGEAKAVYKFDHEVMGQDDVELSAERVHIAGGKIQIDLNLHNPYEDMI